VPFGVFRSISDHADNHADVNFLAFVSSVAAPITAGIVEELVTDLR
jgi:nucleoside phosphorylase